MHQRVCTSRSLFPIAAVLLSAVLSGCGGDDGEAAPASTVSTPSSSTPAPALAPTPVASSQSPSNQAPTISGTAITSVPVNSAYSFTPTALDSDGDVLAFQIQNKPSWATFDTVSGKLSGTPTLAHTGSYSEIIISVNDGEDSASLSAFSIAVNALSNATGSATLSWEAPTQNEDGSALSNLAGFNIHYGVAGNALSKTVRIDNPGVDRFVMDGLPSGTHFFAVSAFTSSGVESMVSNVVSRVIE
jgi:hypothetical protein